ncbi:MAG: saccharopine dehydrogenase NADP-binding domain-containing protein [Anaerolineales bacterium]
MKVLLLGGTGSFGKQTAVLLSCESLITEIGIASRNLEYAQGVAAEIGDKAHGVYVDIRDRSQLSSTAAGYDIIINTAGPAFEVQVPAMQAAIQAGTHYCDLATI